MRAWLLHDTSGPSGFSLEEIETPEPGPGDVRVRLRVSALNHLDLWVSLGMPKPHSYPHVAGGDGAGVVDAVGPGVDTVTVGDEVIINPSVSCGHCAACLRGEIVFCPDYSILGEHENGTLAEHVVVPAANAVLKPSGLDWDTAGSFGLATGTAFRMLRRARLRAGETLLVVGVGGGVSSAALQLGVAMGARVYATSRDQHKLAWAESEGALGGFASDGEFSKDLKASGAPADVVVENVGPATWNQSIRSLAPGGRVVVCGSTSGPKVELSMPVLFFKQLEIIGSSMFTHAEFGEALALVASGAIDPPVDEVFPFEDLPRALDRLEQGRQLGKIALQHGS